MKKAEWVLDYDYQTDRCYRRPGCPKCQDPVGPDGKCYSCRREYELDDEMRRWFDEKYAMKTEMEDCHKIGKFGCDGKGCVETHYRKNLVTGDWEVVWSVCHECGQKIIV